MAQSEHRVWGVVLWPVQGRDSTVCVLRTLPGGISGRFFTYEAGQQFVVLGSSQSTSPTPIILSDGAGLCYPL